MASAGKATKKMEADTDQFPNFPRSLTKSDRNTLANGAADEWAAGLMSKAAATGVKIAPFEEMLIQMIGLLIINHRWTSERIEELERKLK